MKKPVIILLHIGYWLVFMLLLIVLFALSNAAASDTDNITALSTVNWYRMMFATTILPGAICFYGYYTVLFSRFLQKRRIGAFFIGAIVVPLMASIIGALVGSLNIFIGPDFVFNKGVGTSISMLFFLAFVGMLNGVVGLVMRGFITWYGEIKLKEELNRKNFEMELALVKSQINPHFLFNTINNIDVLITKEPEQASKYLNTLSDIMRFMLYETKPDRIYVSKELSYIEKFISLHKIRSNNADYIHFEVNGNAPNLMIAPMLFIPFIENAFKHVYDKKAKPAIKILISFNKEGITFECENNFNSEARHEDEHSGLGDGLIRRRLQLLYPDSHDLEISTTENIYKVNLSIRF